MASAKRKKADKRRKAAVERAAAEVARRGPVVTRATALYDGKAEGDIVNEVDPDGRPVSHAYRRDTTAADRLYRSGALGDKKEIGGRLHAAAERFRADFERAQLAGHLAAADLMRGGGGGVREIEDTVVAARQRVRYALGSLGFAPGTAAGSLVGKAAWWALGVCESVDAFTWRMRGQGLTMDSGKACGLTIAAIERLAIHYGIIGIKSVEANELRRALARELIRDGKQLQSQAEAARVKARYAERQRRALMADDAGEELQQRLRRLLAERKALLAEARVIDKLAQQRIERGQRMLGNTAEEDGEESGASAAA